MREIKFRAWNVATKVMIDLKKITPLALNADIGGLYIPESDGILVMQYTGLKDSKGAEIYEGDIVEWEDRTADDMYGGDVIYPNEPVEFKGGSFYPVCMMPAEEFEIIGNIYENKELLD